MSITRHHNYSSINNDYLKKIVSISFLFDIFNAARSDRPYSKAESITSFLINERNMKLPFFSIFNLFIVWCEQTDQINLL